MLTSQLTKTIEIPNEPGVTVTIRKLSHGQMQEARVARQAALAPMISALGDFKLPDNIEELQEAIAETKTPARQYDRATVLRRGVTAWSYDYPKSDENVDGQDEAWAEFVFDEIMAFSLRSAEEGEASAVGSQSSTSSTASDDGLTS